MRLDSILCMGASGRRFSIHSQMRYGARGGMRFATSPMQFRRLCRGADFFYQVELPEVFFFDHPVDTVVGRASCSDYFVFGQRCTVGNNHGVCPTFGESVFMMSDSKVISSCRIGGLVIIGANTYIKDQEIPSGSLVFGQEPGMVIKERKFDFVMDCAREVFWYE